MKTGFFAYKCMGWEENYLYWDFDALKAFCRSSRSRLSYTPCLKLNPLPMAYIFSVTSFRLSHLPSHHQFNLLQLFMYSPTHTPGYPHISPLPITYLQSHPLSPILFIHLTDSSGRFSSSLDDLKMLSSLRFHLVIIFVKVWFLDSNYVFFCSYCSLCLCLSLWCYLIVFVIVVLLRRAWGKAPIL